LRLLAILFTYSNVWYSSDFHNFGVTHYVVVPRICAGICAPRVEIRVGGYEMVERVWRLYIHLDTTMWQTDRQIDRQTDGRTDRLIC